MKRYPIDGYGVFRSTGFFRKRTVMKTSTREQGFQKPMPVRYRVLDVFQRIIFHERTAWAVQNGVGAIIPLLFMVVDEMNFSGACVGVLFYGVSSQAFSIDRSIGGRTFGGILWTGGFLFAGILAYMIISLAWLARGGAQGILTYKPPAVLGQLTPEEDDIVREYLEGASFSAIPDDGKNDLIPKLEESLKEFSLTVSPAFWIIVMVLHIVFSIFMTRVRTMETDFMNMARGVLSHVYLSVVATLAVLMPLMGQPKFFTSIVGGMMKGVTVTFAGAVIGPLLVYVQSSHDNLRDHIGDTMMMAAKFLTAKASIFQAARMKHTAQDLDSYRSIAHGGAGVSDAVSIIKNSLQTESDLACCSIEPPWRMLTSQPGADYRLYAAVLAALQKLVGSINALDIMSKSLDSLMLDSSLGPEKTDRLWDATLAVHLHVLTALQDAAVALRHKPLFGKCSGNSLSWRPKGNAYWNPVLRDLNDAVHASLVCLKESACKGVASSLDMVEVERMQHKIAKALCITDVAEEFVVPLSANKANSGVEQPVPLHMKCMLLWRRFFNSPYVIAMWGDVKQATSYLTYELQIKRFFDTLKHFFMGRWVSRENIKALLDRRDVQFYLKFFVSVNLAFVAIILICWLKYGNSSSAVKNATDMATFYGNWQPEYFLTATVICLQKQVETSFVKAILRSSMIAIGGVLGRLLPPGTVLTFGGKAVATCLGAVYAMVFSALIKPLYTSEVIFSLEGAFLKSAQQLLDKCFQKGAVVLQNPSCLENDTLDTSARMDSSSIFEKKLIYAARRAADLGDFRGIVAEITKFRVSTFKALGSQKTLNSLDKREVNLIKLTLLPLPKSIYLMMQHLVPFGAYITGASKVMYSFVLGGHGTDVSQEFLKHMLSPADEIFVATRHLANSIEKMLGRCSQDQLFVWRDQVKQDVAALEEARQKVKAVFDSVQSSLVSLDCWNRGDLQCLLWLQMTILAARELEVLGKLIIKDDRCLERDNYWSFFICWYTRRDQLDEELNQT
eukprot:jgi/Picre1/31149/NNA_006503.t1